MLFNFFFEQFVSFFGQRTVADSGKDTGALRQPDDIQDERDPAISHDGGAGKYLDPLQLFAQWFDYNFLGIIDLIDDEAKQVIVRLEHNNVDGLILLALAS